MQRPRLRRPSMAETDWLVAAAEASGCPFKVFEHFLFYPPVVRARELWASRRSSMPSSGVRNGRPARGWMRRRWCRFDFPATASDISRWSIRRSRRSSPGTMSRTTGLLEPPHRRHRVRQIITRHYAQDDRVEITSMGPADTTGMNHVAPVMCLRLIGLGRPGRLLRTSRRLAAPATRVPPAPARPALPAH